MAVCKLCGIEVDDAKFCPYCGYSIDETNDSQQSTKKPSHGIAQTLKPPIATTSQHSNAQTFLQTQNHAQHSQCSSSGSCGSSCNTQQSSLSHSQQSLAQKTQKISQNAMPIYGDYNDDQYRDPKMYVKCSRCGAKNLRTFKYCQYCLNNLPVYSHQMENRELYAFITQMFDEQTRKEFFLTGVRLILIKMLSNKVGINLMKPIPCRIQQNGGCDYDVQSFDQVCPKCGRRHRSRCNHILTVMDDVCPKCGAPHLMYPCSCNAPLKTNKVYCDNCGNPTLLQQIIDTLNGAEGKGAESLLNQFQNMFHMSLKEQTCSSMIRHAEVLQCKFSLDHMVENVAGINELLARHLRDSIDHSQKVELQDSVSATSEEWGEQGLGFTVSSPQQSESMKELLQGQATDQDDDDEIDIDGDDGDGDDMLFNF